MVGKTILVILEQDTAAAILTDKAEPEINVHPPGFGTANLFAGFLNQLEVRITSILV